MTRPARRARLIRRRGYIMIEMVVAALLATLLATLLGLACATFARPALEVEARARIAQEAILAAQSLACDFGGFLADPQGRTGDLSQFQFLDWDLSHGDTLLLNFRGAGAQDVIVVAYELQGDRLVRSNSATGVTTTVAGHVTGFAVAPDPNNANQAQIQVTISYRFFAVTHTLIGVKPS
jgi:hypothetical protein